MDTSKLTHQVFDFFFRGFTKFNRADFTKLRQEKRVVPDGVNAKVLLALHQNCHSLIL